MEIAEPRPAVRIICLDARSHVLLLHWRDPYDGDQLWEPPGGGIEPGETPLEAARRELAEETGLDPAAIIGGPISVPRDMKWNGQRHVGPESFFLARFPVDVPRLSRHSLLEDERENLQGYAWVSRSGIAALHDPLEPPQLSTVIAALDPNGPWRGEAART